MPIAIAALKPGDRVFDAHRERMGNTMLKRMGVWPVLIKEVCIDSGYVVASWNGNPDRRYYARSGKLPWRRSAPVK